MKLSDSILIKEKFLLNCGLTIQKKHIEIACELIYNSTKHKLNKELGEINISELIGEGEQQKELFKIIRKYFDIEYTYYSSLPIKELSLYYVKNNIEEIKTNLSQLIVSEEEHLAKLKDVDIIKAMTLYLTDTFSGYKTDRLGGHKSLFNDLYIPFNRYISSTFLNSSNCLKNDLKTKKVNSNLEACLALNLFSKEIRVKAYTIWIERLNNFLSLEISRIERYTTVQSDFKKVFDDKLLFISILETIFNKDEAEEISSLI